MAVLSCLSLAALLAAVPVQAASAKTDLDAWVLIDPSPEPGVVFEFPGAMRTHCADLDQGPASAMTRYRAGAPDWPDWKEASYNHINELEVRDYAAPLPLLIIASDGSTRVLPISRAIEIWGNYEGRRYLYTCEYIAANSPRAREAKIAETVLWRDRYLPREDVLPARFGSPPRPPILKADLPYEEAPHYALKGDAAPDAPEAIASVLKSPRFIEVLGPDAPEILKVLDSVKVQSFQAVLAPERGPETLILLNADGCIEVHGRLERCGYAWGLFREEAGALRPVHVEGIFGYMSDALSARVVKVADLDGDGRDELVIVRTVYEDSAYAIETWRDGRFETIYLGDMLSPG